MLYRIELRRVGRKSQSSQSQLVDGALGSLGQVNPGIVEDENCSSLPVLELICGQSLLMMIADELEELAELDLSVGSFSEN